MLFEITLTENKTRMNRGTKTGHMVVIQNIKSNSNQIAFIAQKTQNEKQNRYQIWTINNSCKGPRRDKLISPSPN